MMLLAPNEITALESKGEIDPYPNPSVLDIAKFAVKRQNEKAESNLTLVKVISGEVHWKGESGGRIYELVITAEDSANSVGDYQVS
ncbi:hypothetical protein CASFOL_028658 [Castilleja foliolosa]|uniref:Cystatin domain-containing protein n=1 Tax=Castilleja foliolosa TaxID=1961234 RepID=A0ABD3CEU2_9LAMI